MRIRTLVLAFAIIQECTNSSVAAQQPKIQIVAQVGHAGQDVIVALSPDGKTALSGGVDNSLKLWDVETGLELRSFQRRSASTTFPFSADRKDRIRSIAFSPDSKTALSASNDETLTLWDVASGRALRTITSIESNSVAFSPDGRTMISGGRFGSMTLFDLTKDYAEKSFFGQHSEPITSVALSPDGKTALSSSLDRTAKLWDVARARELRTLRGHADIVRVVSFSPDSKTILTGSSDGTLKLWNAASGEELKTFGPHTWFVSSVAFSADGKTFLSVGGSDGMKVWDVATGRELDTFRGSAGTVSSAVLSRDGKTVLTGGPSITLWDVATRTELKTFRSHAQPFTSVTYSPDGQTALIGSLDKIARLWDMTSGRVLRTFRGHLGGVTSVAYSPDGKTALTGSRDSTVKLWDLASGREIRTLRVSSAQESTYWISAIAFSPDGKTALACCDSQTVRLWDVATGRELKTLEAPVTEGRRYSFSSLAFSPNGKTVLAGGYDDVVFLPSQRTLILFDVASGRELQILKGHDYQVSAVAFSPDGKTALSGSRDKTLRHWDVDTGRELRVFKGHTNSILSVAFSPDGKTALSGSNDKTLRSWDVASGRELKIFQGHDGSVNSVALSPDGSSALSASSDGTARLWDLKTGIELAALSASGAEAWMTFAPSGFFASSGAGDQTPMHVVRGFNVTTMEQVHQSLFSPDLVREVMTGDLNDEMKRAVRIINLEKVLESGPAPVVAITSPVAGGAVANDVVTVAARISDRGKGIGRIEWRVNGITAGVNSKPGGGGADYTLSRQLALDPGENIIEVVAYNASNLLASLPGRTTIKFNEPPDRPKPKLHILAIGINKYVDRGWAPPGKQHTSYFPPLGLAVKDATKFGADMKQAGSGLYDEVRVTYALDQDASHANLGKIVDRLAGEIHPRDTFILFAAAHGFAVGGRYYLIPQDYQGGENPASLARNAIGQDTLQDWLANRIKARKAIVLLDTCRSGALIAGHLRPRESDVLSEAAIGRLHEATGRPVFTAAAVNQDAKEDFIRRAGESHGLFTWALRDALRNGDTNGNGDIELSELVAHVQALVPKLAKEQGGIASTLSGVKGSTSINRGEPTATSDQTARLGSRGEDFALVRRLR